MDREKIDGWCEKGILGLVLAIVVFGPLATGAVRTLEFLIIQWLTIGAAVLWIIRLWLSPKAVLLWPPICWAVLAFVIYAIAQYHFADIEYVARRDLIRVLIYAFLFFIILNNLNRQESTQIVTLTLIFLATLISVYSIYQFATNSPKVWHFIKPANYLKRGGGTYINPNHLAGFLEMLLPIGLTYVLIGRFNHVLKIILGYCSLIILIGIGVTISRGGWLATGATLTVFFGVMFFFRGFRIISISMLALLLIVGGTFASRTEMAKKRFEAFSTNETADYRTYFWKAAIRMWKENPWWGVGPGHYDDRYRQYREPRWETQGRPVNAHNDYLNTVAEWGVAGMTLIATTFGFLAFGIFRTWQYVKRSPNDLESKRSSRTAFVLGASLGLFALLMHSFVEFNMQVPANAILAVTLMALVSSYQRYATERFWFTPGIASRLLLSAAMVAGAGYVGFCSARSFQEYRWLTHAKQAKTTPEKIAAWKKAFAIEPKNFETSYNIGETLRLLSWEGNNDYKTLAEEAMQWFKPGMELNRWNPYNFLRYGMCLDWLNRIDEAESYYKKAMEIDPNGHYVVAHMGWHCFQKDDLAMAKFWFERSLELYNNYNNRNPIAWNYLRIVNERIAEEKAKEKSAPLPN